MRAVESDSVKSARKAKGKLQKACERASEIRERTSHRQEQNRMRIASMRESLDSLVSTQVRSCTDAPRFGTSVPFILGNGLESVPCKPRSTCQVQRHIYD